MIRIYLVQNLLNKKCYVGITKNSIKSRLKQHTDRGFHLHDAIRKHHFTNFSIREVDVASSLDEANELEKYYIMLYNTKVPFGYNLTEGGGGTPGYSCSEEEKKLRSKRASEQHNSGSFGMTGKTHSLETKQKMSDSQKGKRNSLGHKHTEETKLKISNALSGMKRTDEQRQHISKNHADVSGEKNPMFGKRHSPETIEKIRAAAIKRNQN